MNFKGGMLVVVTGAASGIGKTTAIELIESGCKVVAIDLDEKLNDAKSQYGYDSVFIADIADSDAMTTTFTEIDARYGRLDGVAHIAGISSSLETRQRAGQILLDIAEGRQPAGCDFSAVLSDEEWDRVIKVNLYGTFYVLRAAINVMIPHRSGTIVTISSLAADEPYPGTSPYAAAKGGIRVFSQTLASEVIGYGIRVNCVSPGAVETPMWQSSPYSKVTPMPPIGRYSQPEEIAKAISFLLSEDSSYIVGQTLRVNGGVMML